MSTELIKKKRGMEVQGYTIEGLSIGGQETCVIFPGLKLAFDIGRCPQRAISQDFLFISHGHMDHIVCLFTISQLPNSFWGVFLDCLILQFLFFSSFINNF